MVLIFSAYNDKFRNYIWRLLSRQDFETYGDGDVIVGEDQCGIDAGQFTGRHFVVLRVRIAVQVADLIRP